MSMLVKKFSTVFILGCLFEIYFSRPILAETIALSAKATANETSLPHCVNLESDIAEIQGVQKANAKAASKYDGYRKFLRNDTELELATRLVYAETLAANCANQQKQIVDLVASVIGNRIRVREGDVDGVVFQRDQFASSLNMYKESRYRDFLCPKDDELWKETLVTMRANLGASKPTAPIPKDAVNYYLYQHSDRFTAPNWKLEEASIGDEKTRECIRVFRNPAWK